METFVARHPIFDRAGAVYGYDLAFRSGFEAFYEGLFGQWEAVEFQMARNFEELTGHGRAHVLFSPVLLGSGLPALLPVDTLTVGMPADTPAEPEIVEVCRELAVSGYELAMDGFGPSALDSPLLEFVDIARADLAAMTGDERRALCDELARRNIVLLARNVETVEAFQEARDLGACYFQGDYFRKPILQPGKEVTTTKLSFLRVLNEVNRPELAYDELDALIRQDVSMTYRLLRFINSSWHGLKKHVESIRHALVLLGPAEVRVWASLLILREVGRDKPVELLRRSLTRARMAEDLAPLVGLDARAAELFLMGMFSLVDALTDVPMDRVMERLPFGEDVKAALLEGAGPLAPVHQTVLAYELGQWDSFAEAARSLQLAEDALPPLHRISLKWAAEAMELI